MTRALPPMATVSELVATAVRAATYPVSEGSRRNARRALEVRHDLAQQEVEALAALPGPADRPAAAPVPLPRLQRTAG